MDVAESTKVVLSRIQELEPENATKIIGYLLLEHSQQEVIEYAIGPDSMIHSLINEAKAYLSASHKPINSASLQPLPNHLLSNMPLPTLPTISRPFSPITSHSVRAPYCDPHLVSDQQSAAPKLDLSPHQCNDFAGGLHNQAEFLSGEGQLQFLNSLGPDFSSNYCFMEAANGGLGSRTGMRSRPGVTEFPPWTCHCFHRGFCKHGFNCRYGHAQDFPDSLSPVYNLNMNQIGNDDPIFSPGSLEKLEMEIIEILRARGGYPLSIAALPLVYQEMYGRSLQAEGYLTESQRHGKTGYSLTKLLARLKHSIRLIDRAHGQHDLILAEDAPKYEYRNGRSDPGAEPGSSHQIYLTFPPKYEYRNGRSDPGAEPGSSHQIYLTFPAESTFTEEEVAEYFKQYGPVCDVRIPRQEKRMFGFVSFMYPETVKLILSKGHPHYICGARVLVKPYKEKSKMNDRKYSDKVELPVYYHSPYTETDPELNSFPRACGNPMLLEKHLIQDSAQFLELERRRLFELHLSPEPLTPHSYFTSMNELKFPDDYFSSLPVLNKCSTDEKARNTSNCSSDQDSVHIELPDNPFASPC